MSRAREPFEKRFSPFQLLINIGLVAIVILMAVAFLR